MAVVLFLFRINLVGFLQRLVGKFMTFVRFCRLMENHEKVCIIDVNSQTECFFERLVPVEKSK